MVGRAVGRGGASSVLWNAAASLTPGPASPVLHARQRMIVPAAVRRNPRRIRILSPSAVAADSPDDQDAPPPAGFPLLVWIAFPLLPRLVTPARCVGAGGGSG